MTILNFGSINIDHVYNLERLARPGETVTSCTYRRFAGGKGLNQSIAIARAGAAVRHVGKVGTDGGWLVEVLRERGVDVSSVTATPVPTGHAVIQVDTQGENSIVLFGGANRCLDESEVEAAVRRASPGDVALTQNETSSVASVLRASRRAGLTVVFNPAPMTPEVLTYPLECVDLLILNETEAEGITGEPDLDAAATALRARYPRTAFVLTRGPKGAVYGTAKATVHQPARKVRAVDTTAAGDVFTGFFLAAWAKGDPPEACLRLGCDAAALSVTRSGAAESVPLLAEVEAARWADPARSDRDERTLS